MRIDPRTRIRLERTPLARDARLPLGEPGHKGQPHGNGRGGAETSPEASGDARSAPPAPRRALTVGWTAIVIAAFVASLLATPLPERDPGPPDLPALVDQLQARQRTDLFSGRPAYLPEPRGPLSTSSPPSPLVDTTLVAKTVPWEGGQVPYLVPDTALPLRYHVDQRLVDRFGLDAMVSAMAQWDGIPGSRWATELAGVTTAPQQRPRGDGASVVFLRENCRPHYLGGAHWNSAPGTAQLEARYGTAALYSPQIDIGLCETVASVGAMRAVIAHEVGHMMGMAHLCEPGEVCWEPGLDGTDRHCRVMYFRFGHCREGVDEREHDAARHLYPTLPRLHGPTPEDTAARASYATTWTHTGDRVVVASLDGSAYTPPLAAALAGTHRAPLLLARPDPDACLTGSAADELSRAASNPGTVILVGTWPEVCEERLAPWDLQVRRVSGEVTGEAVVTPPTPGFSVQVAEAVTEVRRRRGEYPESALLVVADGSEASLFDAASAAAVAGHRGVPLLYTQAPELSEAVQRWLALHPTVRRVQVLGQLDAISNEILDDLVALGLFVVRVPGSGQVERALRLAERERPFGLEREGDPVVVASAGALHDAVVGASVAARLGAPLVLADPREPEAVEDWLRRREPHGGYLVGHPDTLPYPLQWAFTTHVLPPGDAAPSRHDAPRIRVGWPLAGHSVQAGAPEGGRR